MNSDLCMKYFGDDVLPVFGQSDVSPTLFIDNWSVHKKFDEKLGKTSKAMCDWVWDFFREEQIDSQSKMYKDFAGMYVNLGGAPHPSSIMDFIKEHRVPVRKLERLCYSYNVQLQYLAPYWSPTNPVEFVWARIKQLVRDMDASLPIEERITRAWASITPEFILQCIDRSIRFCLSWHARFRGAGMIMAVGAEPCQCIRTVQFGPLQPSADEDIGSDSETDPEDEEEETSSFKRFRA